MDKILEVCCGSYYDAKQAELGGAKRVELNSAIHMGGLTPTLANFLQTKANTSLEIVCMVRNRGAGFCYDEEDVQCMLDDAKIFLDHGADGIAFGFLNSDKSVNQELTSKMVELIHRYGKTAVFHRAIDVCSRYEQSFEDLIACGIDRILTSGSYIKAIEGVDRIRKVNMLYGDKVEIMAGCGIDESNIDYVLSNTKVNQIHCSCKNVRHDPTTSNYGVNFSYMQTNKFTGVDAGIVSKLIGIMNAH